MKLKRYLISPFWLCAFCLILPAAGCSSLKSENEKLKEEITDINAENDKLRKELNVLKTENSKMHVRVAQLHLEIATLHSEIQSMQKDLDRIKEAERKGRRQS